MDKKERKMIENEIKEDLKHFFIKMLQISLDLPAKHGNIMLDRTFETVNLEKLENENPGQIPEYSFMIKGTYRRWK